MTVGLPIPFARVSGNSRASPSRTETLQKTSQDCSPGCGLDFE